MENSKEIFALALELGSPWYIKSVEFDKEHSQLDIHIGFTRGHKFEMSDGEHYTAHDTVERTWQHLNFFQHHCYLHAKVPRVKQADGKIVTQPVPWAREGSGFTLLFEAYIMLLIESEMPVNKISNLVGVTPGRIWRAFGYWIELARKNDEIDNLEKIGIDETSVKKGHQYVTTLVDLDQRRVLYATEGKGADTIGEGVDFLKTKKVNISGISKVCIDMSPAFISGCTHHLPHAAVTFDKFHVMKEINKAMDELRKKERKGNALLKKHKYTFLKNHLSDKKQLERDYLSELFPKLGEGYRLKMMFNEFWEMEDKNEAQSFLAFWCDLAEDSGIFPFKDAVKTIKAHWNGIINYIESKINNGILEGINAKIQLAKKRARGYTNTQNFINMIYFIAGKLKFNYPLYLT